MPKGQASSSRKTNDRSNYATDKWRHRSLIPETRFDIVGKFREDAAAKSAYKQIKRRRLAPLLSPAHDVYYPRYVKLFYKNLAFDEDKPGVLASVIDGVEFEVSIEDIAEAMGLPHECPPDLVDRAGAVRYGVFPENIGFTEIIDDMCEGRYTNDDRNCTSKSLLPASLWLIDTVLQRNVCPLGHKSQRRGDFLNALYAFHGRYWVSIPHLIWLQMHKCWHGLVHTNNKKAAKWALPFPFLVTKLILEKGITVEEGDYMQTEAPVFGVAQWNQSVSHMPRYAPGPAVSIDEEASEAPRDEAPAADAEMADADMADADMAEDAASFDTEERVMMSRTEFDYLREQLDDLRFEVSDYAREFREDNAETQRLLRDLLARLPGPHAP
jgi:hypothetical protein